MSANIELDALPATFNLAADYKGKIVLRNIDYKSRNVCSVPSCFNRASTTTTMHKFPRKQFLRRLWKSKIKIQTIKTSYVVCSQHFNDDDYTKGTKSKRGFLKSDAVPSKNLGKPVQRTPASLSAQRRAQKMDAREKAYANATNTVAEVPKVLDVSEGLPGEPTRMDIAAATLLPKRVSMFKTIIACDKSLNSWTGIPSLQLLETIRHCVSQAYIHGTDPLLSSACWMPLEEKTVLCFVKLKTNLSFACMAHVFSISPSGCARIFSALIPMIRAAVQCIVYFPSVEEIRLNLPKCFQNDDFADVRAVLHCTEVPIQTSKFNNCEISTYASYKRPNTMKFLISITPGGLISHVSGGYPQKASDKCIFNQEKLIEKFEFGDAIMVDKGFLIETEVKARGIRIIREAQTTQFEQSGVHINTKCSVARVHVEQVIQRMKVFAVMSDKIEYNILPETDDIVFIIASIVNLSSLSSSNDKFE